MSFFLFGPRGTGKTTWVRQVFPEAYRIDLLDEALYQSYLADIGLFAQQLRAVPRESWVVVDEVQRIPTLLNEVHRFMEERNLRFVLCGSSARKLKQSGTNLLAGRALRKFMHPFLPEELGERFDVEETLCWGSLPVIWAAPDKKGALEAYVTMYLKEEIKAEAIVRNLPAFARFFPLAALFHGQVLNISGLSRDAGVSRTTVTGYLEVLEDTLLAFRLPAYPAGLPVREKKHPKLYWADPGLVRPFKNRWVRRVRRKEARFSRGGSPRSCGRIGTTGTCLILFIIGRRPGDRGWKSIFCWSGPDRLRPSKRKATAPSEIGHSGDCVP